MVLLLLLQTAETIKTGTDIIDKFGFPVAVAIGLMVFLAYIFRTVWVYVTAKIDEKDLLLAEQTKSRKEFNDRLLHTQDRLVTGQRNIDSTLQTTNEMIAEMACLSHRKG